MYSSLQLDVRSPSMHSEQTQYAHPMLVQCRASIADGGPTPDQHQANVSSVMGYPDFQYKKPYGISSALIKYYYLTYLQHLVRSS